MADEHNRSVAGAAAERVYAVYEFLSAKLEARLGRVRVPSRLVVVRDDPRPGHLCRQHVKVLEPVDVLLAALPCPRPVHIRPKAMDGNDAALIRLLRRNNDRAPTRHRHPRSARAWIQSIISQEAAENDESSDPSIWRPSSPLAASRGPQPICGCGDARQNQDLVESRDVHRRRFRRTRKPGPSSWASAG
jgi:hypothetical protein